ncbi:ABC transporter substrate-binding protein [Candidatus Dependentiae bacterium]|nr:ABC transporter substrate-binding protein [Candidatus Dependentiae bacterium]
MKNIILNLNLSTRLASIKTKKFFLIINFSIVFLLFSCSGNESNNKKIKIGVLDYVNSLYTEEAERGILDGLKENSLTADCFIDIKNAQGDMSVLNSAADLFAQSDYDLIFAITPPSLQIAIKKIKNKPIIFTNAGNPIEAGIGKSFEEHLPNVTGICTITDFEAAIKIIKNFYPNVKKIGTLFTPSETDSTLYYKKFSEILASHSIELIGVPINSPSDIPEAASALCEKDIDVLCQIIDNLTGSAFVSISHASQKTKIPLFCFGSQNVKKGFAVAAASRDYYDCAKEAVNKAVRILAGEKPEKIPVTKAQKTKMVLNKILADYYNIKLSPENTKIFTEFY